MGYLHINNLYKKPDFLDKAGPEVYALEKIHGSSAHVRWGAESGLVAFHVGGEKHRNFVDIFNVQFLTKVFLEIHQRLGYKNIIVYGEVYGGRQQGMKDTYGPHLSFVAFDVFADNQWLNVPEADAIVKELGLEFVDYERGPNTLEWLNSQRDRPSTQAVRKNMGADKVREGVVVRPLKEVWNPETGERLIVKHKGDAFRETATPRDVDPNRAVVLEEANAIAEEWVTEMRLEHVLQKVNAPTMKETDLVINAMLEDVQREGVGEIIWSDDARRAISKKTAILFKKKLSKS